MGVQSRFSGGIPRWFMPTLVAIIVAILVLGPQIRGPHGAAIVTDPKERQLQASDIGGAKDTASLSVPPSPDTQQASGKGKQQQHEEHNKPSSSPAKVSDSSNDDYKDSENPSAPDYEESEEEQEEQKKEQEAQVLDDDYVPRELRFADDEATIVENNDSAAAAAAVSISPSSAPQGKLINGIMEYGSIHLDRKSPLAGKLQFAPNKRFPPDMPFIQAIATCDTFECVRDAHQQPRFGARFNFPHLMIIGWQKSATTSLYVHLVRHKYIARPAEKEPEFFSLSCRYRIPRCTPEDTKDYLHNTLNFTAFLAHGGNIATFEASTHYARGYDRLAAGLYNVFPWVKIIMMMREPISRAMSMLIHNVDMSKIGCLTRNNNTMAHCLLRNSQISGDREFPKALNYSAPLMSWLENFPAGQVQVLQYEELVSAPEVSEKYLRQVKKFIGVDPDLPKDSSLPQRNMRKDRLGTEGWPMTRKDYMKLIELVRPDCEKIAQIVAENGFGDYDRWLGNWEDVWQRNLDTCDDNGNCMIAVS